MGIVYRLPDISKVARRERRATNWFDLGDTVRFQLSLRVEPLHRDSANCDARNQC